MKMLDLMSVTHFLIYFFVGIVFKNNYLLIFYISIIWEIFEFTLIYNKYTYQLLKRYWFVPEKYWNENIYNSLSDIVINLFGYFIGNKFI